MLHWLIAHLSQETGVSESASRSYNFFSGIGSDLGELAFIGMAVGMYRKANCGVKGCWRIGRHKYKIGEVEHVLCRHHHPSIDGAVTAEQIEAHENR